jgi:hypothetical protein
LIYVSTVQPPVNGALNPVRRWQLGAGIGTEPVSAAAMRCGSLCQ